MINDFYNLKTHFFTSPTLFANTHFVHGLTSACCSLPGVLCRFTSIVYKTHFLATVSANLSTTGTNTAKL